jgi:hypothetical protein
MSTPFIADPRLLDLPGFQSLLELFSDRYDSTRPVESLVPLVSRENLLAGVALTLEHEFTEITVGRSVTYRALNAGSITLLHGEYGSLSVRHVDTPSPLGVCATVLQDTVVFPLTGGPMTGWIVSVDDRQPLDDFKPDAAILRSNDTVLAEKDGKYLLARAGYDAFNWKTAAPAMVAEFRLHAPSAYSWLLHETSRRPIRLVVQNSRYNHQEMMISYLEKTPLGTGYGEVVQEFIESPCHFVRWAAYRYLLQAGGRQEELLTKMKQDPHPHMQVIAEKMQNDTRAVVS